MPLARPGFDPFRTLGTTRELLRSSRMSDKPIYDNASKVKAEDGSVTVNGPDEVDVVMTPEAAEETSERLSDEAVVARGQRRLAKLSHRPK